MKTILLISCLLYVSISSAQDVNFNDYSIEKMITYINKKLACCSSNKSIKIAVSDKGILTQNIENKYALDLNKTVKTGNEVKSIYDLEYIKFSNNDYRIININNEEKQGAKLIPFASSFSTEIDAKNVLKALAALQNNYSFLSNMSGGFEDSGDDTLFNALAEYAKKKENISEIEKLLNTELKKQLQIKPAHDYDQLNVVQNFKIDENNILSFSTKNLYQDSYSITKQEVALKNLMLIGKDRKIQFITFGKEDVKYITKTYNNKGEIKEENKPFFDSMFVTYLSIKNNEAFGNKLVELMQKSGFTIKRANWWRD
ncbi:hypothetical protein ACEN2I_01620 [Flavobacterium sp. W22_SRS_FK3]|uniref:hypothetical protein n=1 Tax=Flavobacterium sp. W22_SRS_FK3 TaxID=3240275 RepID=UPI003F921D99